MATINKNTKRITKGAGAKSLSIPGPKDLLIGIEQITEDDILSMAQLASAIFTDTKFPYELKAKIKKEMLPKFMSRKSVNKKGEGMAVVEMMKHFGLDTQLPLCESVDNGAMAMEISKQLIKEYDCKTTSEKATAQIVANAYARIMECSYTMRASRNDSIDYKLIPYFAVLSKELDRAIRQYESALNTLIRIKSPAFKINVIAKNAFVAKNQQINFNKTNNENIKPK